MEIWGSSQAANRKVSTPGLDIWVYSQPREQASGGGDVHYVSLCGGGITTRLILADVSGHGASVADLARGLRDLMRRNINRKNQAKLVKELNRQFGAQTKVGRFATAVVATYLATSDRLTICNAGHPRPLLYRSAARQWSFLMGKDKEGSSGLANLPLGIDDSTRYPQVELALEKGDFLLFYTDALTEAVGVDGRQLGESGLVDRLSALDLHDPTNVAGLVVESLNRYRDGKPAEDDLTFLLLHHNSGRPRRLTLGQKITVYAKVFGLKHV